MDWRGDQTALIGGEKIFVHLINEDGGILAQADPILQLNAAERFTSLGLRLPAALPSGPFRLITGLYDASLEGAPKTVTENGMDSVVLSEFEIEATEKQFGDRVETPSSLLTPSMTSYANRQK